MTLLAPQSDTDGDRLAALAVELDAAQHIVGRMHDYYAGRHPLAFATPKFAEAFGGLFRSFASNWCGLVVDVPRQRLRPTGFRFGSGPGDTDAWAIWQANSLDAGSLLLHTGPWSPAAPTASCGLTAPAAPGSPPRAPPR